MFGIVFGKIHHPSMSSGHREGSGKTCFSCPNTATHHTQIPRHAVPISGNLERSAKAKRGKGRGEELREEALESWCIAE
jgi:hypothetical protein